MSEFIFAVGLAVGFILGIIVGWKNAKDKYKDIVSGADEHE